MFKTIQNLIKSEVLVKYIGVYKKIVIKYFFYK